MLMRSSRPRAGSGWPSAWVLRLRGCAIAVVVIHALPLPQHRADPERRYPHPLEVADFGCDPFIEHGAVVAFDFAVGLWPVRAGAFVLDVWAQGVFERVGAVAGAVVGQHPFDGDSAGFEVGVGAQPESGPILKPGRTYVQLQAGPLDVISTQTQNGVAEAALRTGPLSGR
jgi:hypothetical protein